MQVCSCVWTENKGIHPAIMFCKYGWCNQDAGKQYEYKHIRCTMLQKKTTLSWSLNHCYLQYFVITRPFASPCGRGLWPSPLPNTHEYISMGLGQSPLPIIHKYMLEHSNKPPVYDCIIFSNLIQFMNYFWWRKKTMATTKMIAKQLCIGLTWPWVWESQISRRACTHCRTYPSWGNSIHLQA